MFTLHSKADRTCGRCYSCMQPPICPHYAEVRNSRIARVCVLSTLVVSRKQAEHSMWCLRCCRVAARCLHRRSTVLLLSTPMEHKHQKWTCPGTLCCCRSCSLRHRARKLQLYNSIKYAWQEGGSL
jgi:hypothetical protein